jgi:hypothetical protein
LRGEGYFRKEAKFCQSPQYIGIAEHMAMWTPRLGNENYTQSKRQGVPTAQSA